MVIGTVDNYTYYYNNNDNNNNNNNDKNNNNINKYHYDGNKYKWGSTRILNRWWSNHRLHSMCCSPAPQPGIASYRILTKHCAF
jgi:hypothetical protein